MVWKFRACTWAMPVTAAAMVVVLAATAHADKSQLVKSTQGTGVLYEKLIVASDRAYYVKKLEGEKIITPAFSVYFRMKTGTPDDEKDGHYRIGDPEGNEIGWVKKDFVKKWNTRFCLDPRLPLPDRHFAVFNDAQGKEAAFKFIGQDGQVPRGKKRFAMIAGTPEEKGDDPLHEVIVFTGLVESGGARQQELNAIVNLKLEIVFVIDTTMSMEPLIDVAKSVVRDTANTLAGIPKIQGAVRFGIVEYKDAPPHEPFASRAVCQLTDKIEEFRAALDGVTADTNNKNDVPEEVLAGLNSAITQIKWSPNSSKHVILLGDAPAKDGTTDPLTGKVLPSATGLTLPQLIAMARPQGGSTGTQALAAKNFHAVCNNHKDLTADLPEKTRKVLRDPEFVKAVRELPINDLAEAFHVTPRELLKSPTGREVVFWSAQHGELLRPSTLDSFGECLGGVDLIVPELHRIVSLSAGAAEAPRTLDNVTLYSTRPGDPILAQHRADVLAADEPSLVLADEAARVLKIQAGDSVTATVQRTHEGAIEKATLALQVKRVVPLGSEIGYADIGVLAAMEQYVQGFQVRRFGWPAFAAAAADEYSGYLIFCEKTNPLTDEDVRSLRDRGFSVERVQDAELSLLYGLLVPRSKDALVVYRLAAHAGGREQWQRLRIAPSEIARLTEADDVVVPWSEPRLLPIDGKVHRIVGLSMPERTWLRLYLRDSHAAHPYDADTFSIALAAAEGDVPDKVSLQYAGQDALSLKAVAKRPRQADAKSSLATQAAPPAKTPPESKADGGAKLPSAEKTPQPKTKPDIAASPAPSAKSPPASKADGAIRLPPAEKSPQSTAKPQATPNPVPPQESPASKSVQRFAKQTPKEEAAKTVSKSLAGSIPPPAGGVGPRAKAAGAEKPAPKADPAGAPIVVVPVDLLAYLHAFDAGRVEYDSLRRLFVPAPREPTFERARLYAATIDDVPGVVDRLKERQFAVMSQSTRIVEIQQQDVSLQLLVLIVGAGVFLFGVVTVVTVLLDSTERKRGTIGILRVMGVPRAAIFYMVFLRAALIGSLAAGFTLGLGWLASLALGWEPSGGADAWSWKPIIKVILHPMDVVLVIAGALSCCGLGSLIPAFRASRLDPFDAIVEGRFR